MYRDRTNLYIAYRRTFPHHVAKHTSDTRFDRARDEEEGLVDHRYKDDGGEEDIEMTQLPANLVQLEQESETMIQAITKDIGELGGLYRKNMLPGFNDTSADEAKINEMSMRLTRRFQFMYAEIKQLDDSQLQLATNAENALVESLKKKLALRTQELSTTFRKLQNNYIRYLREDEFEIQDNEAKPTESSIFQEEEGSAIESYSREAMQASSQQLQQKNPQLSDGYLEQREREIYKIAQGVIEISTIFKELETMVIDQGTVLDRIDYNLSKTAESVKKAHKEMKKAEGYQKSTAKCKVVLFLVLLIMTATMLLLLKPSSKSS